MKKNILKPRELGSTGLTVSALGLGTVKIGRNQNVKNSCSDGFKLPSDKEVEQLLDACLEWGINLIDTAPAYGVAEERLGQLMKHRRNDFVLFSKTGEVFENGASFYDFSYKATVKSVQRSLVNLKTDVLEGVVVHARQDDELQVLDQGEVLRALVDLKEKGDIKSFGWSSVSLEGGLKALDVCDHVMVSINPEYTSEMAVVEEAAKLNKGILIKKGLMQGHLSGADAVRSCFKFAENLPGSHSLIAGTINLKHLRDNALKMSEDF